MIGSVAVAIAAIAVAAIIGCESMGGGTRKQNIAAVIQTAYDFGGREMHLRRSRQVPRRAKRGALRSKVARGCAVSNKIEELVAEGKLTPSQAYPPSEASAEGGSMRGVRLHALAQLAYEGIMDDLARGEKRNTLNIDFLFADYGALRDCVYNNLEPLFIDTMPCFQITHHS